MVRLWMVILVLGFGLSGPAAVQIASASETGFDDFLNAAAKAEESGTQLWRHLEGSNCSIVSSDLRKSPQHGAHVEGFFIAAKAAPDMNDFVRWIADDDGHRALVLQLDAGGLPSVVLGDEHVLRTRPAREAMGSAVSPWLLRFDGLQMAPQLASAEPTKRHLHIDLIGFLSALGRGEVPRSSWVHGTRTFLASRSTGTQIQLRFRTPNDQLCFGSPLSSCVLHDSQGLPLVLRCWIVNRESGIRPTSIDVSGIAQSVGIQLSDTVHGRVPELDPPDLPGKAKLGDFDDNESALARRVSHATHDFDAGDERPVRRPIFEARRQELLLSAVLYFHSRLSPPLSGGEVPPNFNEYVAAVVEELEATLVDIEAALVPAGSLPVVDDPAILWRGFELAADSQVAKMVFNDLLLPILASEAVVPEVKLRLTRIVGQLGCPPWVEAKREGLLVIADPPGIADLGKNGRIWEAFLHANWQWSPSDADLAVCRSVLTRANADPHTTRAAITALVAWGRLADVPEDRLDEWFNSQHSLAVGSRRLTWKSMTRTDTGRAFLISRVAALDAFIESQNEIAQMLAFRANATQRAERFDFMPRDECDRVLTTCAPLLSE